MEEGSPEPVAKVVRSRKAMSETDSFFSRSIVRHVFERGEGLVSDDALVDPRRTREVLARAFEACANNPEIGEFKTGVLQT